MSRAERLAELLKKEISLIIQAKLNDHRIGFVSITEVIPSEDLSYAKVYFSCLGDDEEKKKSLKGLMSAIPVIRSILAETIELRIVPKLRFVLDESIERAAQRIDLINKITKEREAREQKNQTTFTAE